ncbi:amino acid ABC transporter permease [Ensifer sp. SSB1]|jgi:polar amino acid transport system permease protein|uniref:amino acid ABC transporter permease n=1 Tax=Ensifer sp. SSB1 TaxID=2795385 RepID=UPI001A48C1C9|nr:amino acid ABC transporter permease [Ensifer sp. SSB1]MBK5567077.1 amino acid ABC transporter permease [Ensifer sp. SSB1]
MSELFEFWSDNLSTMLDGLVVSIQVTSLSLVLGLPLGLLLALGVQSRSRPIYWMSMMLVEIGRGAPALILLQFWYFGLSNAGITLSSFVAAVAALAWNTGAYTSEIIRAALLAVPQGQREAAIATGMNGTDTLRFIIVPQALVVAAPALLGFAVSLLQATSLCFAIALPELLSQAYMIGTNTFRYMPILCLAAILYALLCIPASIMVSALERRYHVHAR